jgi:cyclopropane-fatty-acyl-phospholipid synthase
MFYEKKTAGERAIAGGAIRGAGSCGPVHPSAPGYQAKLGVAAQAVLRAFLRRWEGGSFRVAYWDGTQEQFGSAPPRFCLRIHDPGVVWAMLSAVDLGFGEAYMDGRVEIDHLDALLELAVSQPTVNMPQLVRFLPRPDFNSIRREYRNVQHHYDLGDEFFALWLDESQTYSCAYFEAAGATLEAAQRAKRLHILRKLQVEPGQTLLDIGCGWGALLFDAARQYGAAPTGSR